MRYEKLYTKTGDKGTTVLWDGSTVSKNNIRVQLLSEIDHSHAAIGLCHKYFDCNDVGDASVLQDIYIIQNALVEIMGQIATIQPTEKQKRRFINEQDINIIEQTITNYGRYLDGLGKKQNHWKMYGEDGEAAAQLDFACTQIRKCEPPLCASEFDSSFNIIRKYINMLSKAFYLLARMKEKDK